MAHPEAIKLGSLSAQLTSEELNELLTADKETLVKILLKHCLQNEESAKTLNVMIKEILEKREDKEQNIQIKLQHLACALISHIASYLDLVS